MDRAAFITRLNATLPRKRVIAQGLIRDGEGDGDAVLLCELIYKAEWDLPGGVVDHDEAPADTVARELREELGLELPVGSLAAVNWLPPYRQWDDALLLVFEVAASRERIAEATLQRSEVAAVHWCDERAVAEHAAPYVARHLGQLLDRPVGSPTIYLQDGQPLG